MTTNLNETFAAVQVASRELALLNDNGINQILNAVADAAIAETPFILSENEKDLARMDKNDPKYDISNVFEVNREDIRQVSNLLDQTSIQNKEVLLHVMAKVENKRLMCALMLHTLWSPLKKDGYIGIVGYFESI